MLWAEPAGQNPRRASNIDPEGDLGPTGNTITGTQASDVTLVRGLYNEFIYNQIRRMVVIRTEQRHCICL